MAERIPFIVLNLGDGVERRFRFTLNSIIEFQQATGLGLSEFAKTIALMDKDVSLLRKVIWIGVKKEAEGLTEEAVGDLLGLDNFIEVGLKVIEYLRSTMGITEDDLKNAEWATSILNKVSGAGASPSELQPESASSPESSTT
jgi:hypothetical protein